MVSVVDVNDAPPYVSVLRDYSGMDRLLKVSMTTREDMVWLLNIYSQKDGVPNTHTAFYFDAHFKYDGSFYELNRIAGRYHLMTVSGQFHLPMFWMSMPLTPALENEPSYRALTNEDGECRCTYDLYVPLRTAAIYDKKDFPWNQYDLTLRPTDMKFGINAVVPSELNPVTGRAYGDHWFKPYFIDVEKETVEKALRDAGLIKKPLSE